MIVQVRIGFLLRALFLVAMVIAVMGDARALAVEPQQQGALKILFIGNSHLFLNDVPDQVRARLRTDNEDVEIQMFASGGARLIEFTEGEVVADALKAKHWDVVVLQEASISFLSARGRRDFHRALDWFLGRLPHDTRVILYQTWPWQDGSPYLFGRAEDEAKMWSIMQSEYATARQNSRVVIAPVGQCWVKSPRRAAFYSADGNHATAAGSTFAATVIANTIRDGRHKACPAQQSRSQSKN